MKNRQKAILWVLLALLLLALPALCFFLLRPATVTLPPRVETAEDETALIVFDEVPAPVSTPIPHYDPSMTGEEGWVQADGKLFYLQGGGAVTGLRIIDGKYYYFDPNGVKAAAIGVDVSTYNENIDWDRVKAQGVDFAIIRAGGRGWTSGSIYGDLRCEGYLRNARKAGLQLGVYFYGTAVNEYEAAAEADAVLRVLKGRALELPVYYDAEASGEFPHGRADRLPSALRTRLIQVFCERIEAAGYTAGVYSGAYFLRTSLNWKTLDNRPVWAASYSTDRTPPRYPGSYQIWQFTDRGNVDGICCGVDMNVMFSRPGT